MMLSISWAAIVFKNMEIVVKQKMKQKMSLIVNSVAIKMIRVIDLN